MRSRTSCFHKTLFVKNLKRFWPVWFGGTLLWFLLEPMYFFNWANNPSHTVLSLRQHMVSSMCSETHIVWFLYALPVAMAVFSWLYNARSVGFTAALPLTRKQLFATGYLSGLVMLLSTLLLTGALLLGISLSYGGGAEDLILQWMLESLLDIVGFYGFAALCAMLTGNLVILPLCALVLEFAAVLIEELVRYLMGAMLFGYSYDGGFLAYASPLWTLCSSSGSERVLSDEGFTVDYAFSGMGPVALYALCGVLFTLLALRLLQNRRMESAGDTVAIGVLKPVFRWCMAIGCALLLAVSIYDLTLSGRYTPCTGGYFLLILALLLLGGLMGWFGADMLMQKSFRVFKLHRRGALLLCGILLSFGLALGFDVLGLESRIPERESIDSVVLSCDGESAELSEEESIEQALKLHKSILTHKSVHESNAVSNYKLLYIEYFRDGKVVEARSYYLDATKEAQNERNSDLRFAERVLNLTEAIVERKKLRMSVSEDSIDYAALGQWEYFDPGMFGEKAVDGQGINDSYGAGTRYFGACKDYAGGDWRLSPREAYELYTECIIPDLQEGTLGRIWLVKDEEYAKTIYNIRFSMDLSVRDYNGNQSNDWFYTVPTIHSRRTNAWLEAHGVVLETYWDYLSRMDGLDTLG